MPVSFAVISRPVAAGIALFLLGGCSGDDDTKTTPPGDDTAPDTEAPPDTAGIDSAVDTGTPGPVYDCYANVTIDEGTDGTTDGSGYDGYDAANPTWLLYRERDYNGNGTPEQFFGWVRDEAGRVLHFEAWGTSAEAYDATYDEDGNRLTYDEDTDGDGDIDRAYTYTYEDGALVRSERDDGADGLPDNVVTYVRDAEGRRLSMEEDEDGDGVIDVWTTYAYDDQGREIEAEIDEGNDGVLEALFTTTYTDPVLRVGTSSFDVGIDGVLEQVIGFAYDEAGRELYYAFELEPVEGVYDYERWSDRDENGAITHYRLFTALYGDPLELEQDLTYDGLGRLTSTHTVVRDVTRGTVDSDTTYTYLFGGTCPSP